MLSLRSWLVVGDVLNAQKPAHQIVHRLLQHQRIVHSFNPRVSDVQLHEWLQAQPDRGEPNSFARTFTNSLTTLSGPPPTPIDVIDLCIHPSIGLGVLQQAHSALGIKNVFIQPGAGSKEIIDYCAEQKLAVHEGCVLREMQ